MNPTGTDRAVGQLEHLVQLYDDDVFLVASLQQFLAAGLSAGEACVVIATASHRADVETALYDAGFDVAALVAEGQFASLDAKQTLDAFMIDGVPQPQLFFATLNAVLDRAGGRMVRAFGEMVALLWAEDNVTGALELEQLWNELGTSRQFSLLCAYPVDAFSDPVFAVPFRQVCATHSRVLPAESQGSVTLPAELSSGSQARRYLRETLPPMGCLHVLEDAVLLLTELVNNAVIHANSGAEVQIRRTADSLYVEVTDKGAGGALRRDATTTEMGGRGLALLDCVARSWGTDTDGAWGHRVWFELDLTV